MSRPRAWLCPHCGNVDDLEPFVRVCKVDGTKTLESRRCPCPHDEVTSRQRQIEVEMRHRAAVSMARERARWRTWRERNAS